MNYKILMVDDDRELLKMLNQYFTLKNYTVMIAENGIEAHIILQRGRKSSMISPTLRLKEKCMRAIFQPRLKSTERYGMKR